MGLSERLQQRNQDLDWAPMVMDPIAGGPATGPTTASMAGATAPHAAARPDRRLLPSDLKAFARTRAANAAHGHPDAGLQAGAPTVERRNAAELAGLGARRSRDAGEDPALAQWQAQWQSQLDEARAEGFREGLRVAHEDHGESLQKLARSAAERQAELLGSTQHEMDRLRSAICDRLLEVAVQTGAAVACRAIDEHRERIAFVLDRLFGTVVEDFRTVELLVNPEDERAARAWLEPGMAGRTLTLRTDASLRPGSCMARIDDTVVDASVQQRIRHAFEAFGLPPSMADGVDGLLPDPGPTPPA